MNFLVGGEAVTPEQIEERRQARERMLKLADPQLLRRVERWIAHGMVPLNPKLPMAIRPQYTRFDNLADWYCGYLGVRGEVEPSPELMQDLKEGVPQSILRDIFRPVRASSGVEPHYHELHLDPGGRRGWQEVREAQKREPLPTIEPAVVLLMSEQRRRRRFLKRPWQSFRKDDAPRFYTDQTVRFDEIEDADE